ncbi:MAG TPA: carboxypeptidase-like regulatory domain-containing protein [Candidatus Acidoferrum sp.]|nr:carboxypeptidase-like regulatory domain-containing protein [Candidatus Acidoferrum sp.]
MKLATLGRVFLTSLSALVLVVASAWAQTGTTSVRGTVLDKSGAAVVGATVTLVNADQGVHQASKTSDAGSYEFLALPPGTYSLTIEMPGFRKWQQKNVQLLVNSPTTLNVSLEVGANTETVEVSAQAVTLNTSDASLGNAFSERQVKDLPLEAGNVPELLSLQAGVAYTGNRPDMNKDTDTRNGAVNGARSDQSNVTLDGVDVNADTKGYAFTSVLPITQDSVEEFRVTTSNYNADEGRSSGAQVALVTKSGTNNFHGAAFWSHRNTATSANDYFVKLAELQSGAPNTPPKLLRNNFGAALGGPVKKDRLFFFANYEGHRQREAQSVVRVIPSASMQDGVVMYQCADPTACPGGTVQGLSASHNVPAGDFGLTPANIKGMDPQNIGVSTSVMIPYLQSFSKFPANDNSVGDGLNFVGYRFKGPVAVDTNWYIARVDYKLTSSGNHALYWRGALRNDFNNGAPYLPGGPPEVSQVDYSKGFSVGYTAVLRSNLVNNFRYGYTRQSFGEIGNQTQDQIFFRGLNDNSSSNNASLVYTNNSNFQVPVNNFVDDISWVKGKHTLQFGANINILRNPQSNNINSFTSASDNPSWLDTAAMAGTGVEGHFDPFCSTSSSSVTGKGCYNPDPTSATYNPTEPHYPAVNSGFGNSYDYPLGALIGMVTQVNAQYNFTRTGGTLADGQPVSRRFATDTYEMYAEDIWKAKPSLTLTFGLRYSLFSPPWETNGLQVTPARSLSDYFTARGQGMLQGNPASAQCCMSFNLGGPANNAPGFYNWDTKDFGPHVAFAWSPQAHSGLFKGLLGEGEKTVIRGGFGLVYDRIGPELLATFDANGSFGLSTTLTNTGGKETPAIAPRATGLGGISSIPTVDLAGHQLFAPAPAGTFPQTFPNGLNGDTGSYAVYFGMDNKLKTPYSYTLDLSVGRELGHDFALQVSYVGRLSHRLLSQVDVASPLDLVDPKTKIDYFTAVTALAKLYRTQPYGSTVTPAQVGPTAQYWYDILQKLPASNPGQKAPPSFSAPAFCGLGGTTDALQAAYDLFSCFQNNETTGIQALDQGWGLTDPNSLDAFGNPTVSYYASTGPYTFVDPQFASLYAWRSIGAAAYNSLQVNVQKHMSHGLQFDFNYTYSKSMDISSDANRIGDEGGLGGQVIDPWHTKALRAVSDFDLTHQFNANWIAELPFGRGRWLGSESHGVEEALIGGWQLSGLARWTSGFPIGVGNGAQWPTNWELSGFGQQMAPVKTRGAVKNPDGTVSIFGDVSAATAAFNAFSPDLPGQVGNRNSLRGDGFAGLDLGLMKRWKVTESNTLLFRWDVFNALNLTRFDVQSLSLSLTNESNFGNYTGLLTNPRVMQFTLRYEF